MGRRTLLLIASILVAAVGTALIFLYANSAQQRANKNIETVRVVMSTSPIPSGQTISASFTSFKLTEVARGSIPPDASVIYVGDAGLSALNNRKTARANFNIAANSIIQKSFFTDANAAAPSGLARGQFAVSVQLSNPDRVAGLIKPGSIVAVTFTPASGKPIAFYLMKDITVLSVGITGQAAAVPGGLGEPVDNNVIALVVNAQQALKLHAGEQGGGQLRLALEGPSSGDQITADTKIDILAFS